MAIYQPESRLTSTEKELLQLLANLVIGGTAKGSNIPANATALSDAEATRLLDLLEKFASSRKFIEGAYFAERLTDPKIDIHGDVREIYLSWRKRYGRSRALASTHWFDFLRRFGRQRASYAYVRGLTRAPDVMDYQHFRKMEQILLRRSSLSLRVRALILNVVDKYENEVELARKGEKALELGAIAKLPQRVIDSLSRQMPFHGSGAELSSGQVAGLMTVVSDMSVMFTTRDWGVAGTISTIAGGMAASSVRD